MSTSAKRNDNINTHQKRQPSMLIVSGSDSGGAAGMQADLKTASLLGVYGFCAVTAVTAQNSRGIASVMAVEPETVVRQIDVALEDARPDAVKVGMLPSSEHIEAVADALIRHGLNNIVVDPILAATSGDSLCRDRETTARQMLKLLAPAASAITPNLPEAAFYNSLVGINEDCNVENLLDLFSSKAVVLKGGHRDDDAYVTDVACYSGRDNSREIVKLKYQRIATTNLHGTGCVFSSALAACLAKGMSFPDAFVAADDFVHTAIYKACFSSPYAGYGPLYLFP